MALLRRLVTTWARRSESAYTHSGSTGKASDHGVPHDRGEVDARPSNLDLVAGEPRGVEQVVDEPYELLELALENRQGTPVAVPTHFQQLQRVAHRGKRVPQLVGERRQELPLPPVRLPEPADDHHRIAGSQ